jgi:hypothetical protein
MRRRQEGNQQEGARRHEGRNTEGSHDHGEAEINRRDTDQTPSKDDTRIDQQTRTRILGTGIEPWNRTSAMETRCLDGHENNTAFTLLTRRMTEA